MIGKSWRDTDEQLKPTRLSLVELHLIQRLRQLGQGLHLAIVLKRTRGRDGLEEFKVQESIPVPENGKDN